MAQLSELLVNGHARIIGNLYAPNATTSVAGLMSADDKTKLNGIESGAEVNDIATIQVNGTAQPISSKTVNISIPTKTSDLTNDSNFVISPLMTKTYTGIQGSGDNGSANYAFYYMSIVPDSYTESWSVRYRIRVWIPGQTNFEAVSDSFLTGDQGSTNAYAFFNRFYSTSYRPVYYQSYSYLLRVHNPH